MNYTWDNNGNLLNDGSTLYRYDQANRLISTTVSGVTTLFNYNGDGVRLRQVVAGTPTSYTQDLAAPLPVVLQSKTGGTTTKYLYSMGTRPLAQYTLAWEYLNCAWPARTRAARQSECPPLTSRHQAAPS